MEKSFDLCSNFQLEKGLNGGHLHEDRISSLSDDVLLFILSFLSFKEVVKTSHLSHRWLNLWVHTPVLDIQAPVTESDLINDTERRNYIEWVNHVLQRHKCPYLEEFKIVCHLDECNEKDIESWLVFAFARKVERLELNLLLSGCYSGSLRDNYIFPSRFLDFNNRKAISDGGNSGLLQFDFKYLKSLSLKRVDVTGEAINFFLTKCPFLEQLEVVGTLKLVDIVISDPNLVLKYLKIKACSNLKLLNISNFNLVSLDISSVDDLTLTNLPMLGELSIKGTSEKLSISFSQASSCFSQLEAFTLTGFNLKDVTLMCNNDQFTKLKRLVINVGAFGDESLTTLISIVNSCPQLEEFVLTLYWFKPERTSRTIKKIERRGSSFKSKSLKVFKFLGYYGRVSDVELIMHVVDNAACLEKIIIDPRNIFYIGCRKPPWTSPTMTPLRDKEARSITLQQFDSMRESIPPHVHLLIR